MGVRTDAGAKPIRSVPGSQHEDAGRIRTLPHRDMVSAFRTLPVSRRMLLASVPPHLRFCFFGEHRPWYAAAIEC